MDTVARIKSFMDEKNRSSADVARIAGKSPSTISQILKGTYPGRPEVAEEVLAAIVSHELETASSENPDWSTNGQQLIQSLLSFTYEDREFSVITGPSGIGKTHTIKRFMEKNPHCVYFRCTESMCASDVVTGLAEALGVTLTGSSTRMIRRCVQIMRDRDVRLVVIDEADLLVGDDKSKRRILKKLSYFREINEAGIGVAMVGLESFENAIRAAGETYVLSRIGYYRKATGTSIAELFEYWEHQGLTVDDDTRYAVNLAQKGGYLRLLKKLVVRVQQGFNVREALKLMFNTSGHIKEL